jgi:hypothetical protein
MTRPARNGWSASKYHWEDVEDALRDGRRVRLHSWAEGNFLYAQHDHINLYHSGTGLSVRWEPHSVHVNATEWEILQ